MTGIMLRIVLPGLVVSTILGAVLIYVTSAERAKRELDDARDYIEGTQDAQDAPNSIPDDADGLRGWLLEFAE